MRKYESFFILDPDLSEEVLTGVGEKLKNVVAANGGVLASYTPWGKKKLAYPIKKRGIGYYVLMEFGAGPNLVSELERNMRLDERVLKFITVKLDDEFDPTAAAREEAARTAPPPAEEGSEEESEGEEDAGTESEGEEDE